MNRLELFPLVAFPSAEYLRSERAAEDYTDEVVDGEGRLLYLDKVASVSALIEPPEPIWVDSILNEQHRRFHNAFDPSQGPV